MCECHVLCKQILCSFVFRKIEGLHDKAAEDEEESLEEKKKIFIESMMASDYDKDLALAAWNTIKDKDKKSAGAIEEEGWYL